jgi:glucose/arabinose dehydrogenase
VAPKLKNLALVAAVLVLIVFTQSCGGGSDDSENPPPPPPPGPVTATLTSIASGFVDPLGFAQPNDGTGRFFIVEQRGTIRIIQNGSVVAAPFLDIQALVEDGGELGLLGLAFHPQFAQNRRFYLNYTTTRLTGGLQSVIAEYHASQTDPNRAETTERILLQVNQPFANHNGGQLAFGPDGFLYIALGDGGDGGDPLNNGQRLNTLLGKILRIDVNGNNSANGQYGIPADNPFIADTSAQPEIWAFGLRNPWRFSFDRVGGRLFCGDVGQNAFEEIDIIVRGGNYGWRIMEGAHCFNPSSGCNQSGLILPIAEYSHSEGEAVIGGFVYRGTAIPALQGAYVFADFSFGTIWMLRETSSGTWTRTQLLDTNRTISAFGQDQAGEIYVLDYASGTVLRLSP